MKFLTFFFMIGLSTACNACDQGAPLFNQNSPGAVIAVDVAQAVLEESKPAVNAAIAELPDDVQLLAQMAYGALQAFVSKIDQMQPQDLDVQNPNTVRSTDQLKIYAQDVTNQLDSLIH